MARLGEVATYINGYPFKPEDWSSSGLPIIRIQDLTGSSYQTNRYHGEYDPKYEISSGDVLISWSASLGVYIWNGEKALLNQHIFKVVFDKVCINKSFFVYQVQSILEKAALEAHGATMKHLTKPVFDALPFYLPKIEMQNRIADLLNRVNALIDLRKQQLAKLDELVKARFVEMFGNPQKNTKGLPTDLFENVVKLQRGFDLPVQNRISTGYVPVFGSNGILDYHNSAKVKGGGIITGRSGTIGNVYYTYQDYWPLNTTLFSIDLHGNDIVYLAHLLKMFDLSRFADGTGVPTLNRNNVHCVQIIKVPICEQKKFSEFANKVDKHKLFVQQGLDKLETLKKALMQKYFG